MAPNGMEWHWGWETFGQLPLQLKRFRLGLPVLAPPIRARQWPLELHLGGAKPARTAGGYQISSRTYFRCISNGPRFWS